MKKDQIFSFLRGAPLFDGVNSPALKKLALTAKQIIIDPDLPLILEGDLSGEAWILVEGELLVFTTRNSEEVALARITESGTILGEQAFSSRPLPRNASVRAVKKSFLIELNRDSIDAVVEEKTDLSRRIKVVAQQHANARLTAESSVMKALASQGITSSQLETLKFANGDMVLRQGDFGEDLYVVKSGVAAVRKEDDNKNLVFVARLLPGQSFGERAHFGDGRRTASVYAEGSLELLVVKRKDFHNLIKDDEHLKQYFGNLERAYSLSSIGLVTRYSGQFLGREAVNFLIRREDGSALIASRLIAESVFSLRAEHYDQFKTKTISWTGKDGISTRNLDISDGRVVGAFITGEWDEIEALYKLVIDQAPWEESDDGFFQEKGQIPKRLLGKGEGLVCKCMRLEKQAITALINDGADSLVLLQDRCGAGTMCGGCLTKIESLLGVGKFFKQVKLQQIINHSDDLRSFRFPPNPQTTMDTVSLGQHIVVKGVMDGVSVERPYTLTSSVKEKRWQEITVRRDSRGAFSNHLFNLEEGASLEISDPRGQLYLSTEGRRTLICLVAGVGITPVLNIWRSLSDLGSMRPIQVLHVVREPADLVLSQDLKLKAENKPWLKIDTYVSSDRGKLKPQMIKDFVTNLDADFLICGPVGFQRMICSVLEKAGVEPHRIIVETFGKIGSKKQRISYFPSYLAAGMSLLYFINGEIGPVIDPLAVLHETRAGSWITGLALLIFLGMQSRLSVLRWKQRWLEATRNLDFHRWFGLGIVILLIGHSATLGHGHTFLLSLVLLLVMISSVSLDGGPLSANSILLRNIFVILHIFFSVALIGFVATHIAALIYY